MQTKIAMSHRVLASVIIALSCGVVAAAPTSFHQAVGTSQPILHYRLNEASGPAINYGSLGPSHDATYFGTLQRAATTAQGDAGVIVDGFDDYLESSGAAPAGLTGNPTFTAEAVVAVRCFSSQFLYPPFLHWGLGGQGLEVYFSLHNNDPNKLYVGFYNGGSMTQNTTPVGEWMHLVWVRQGGGSVSSGNTLYVNGQSVALVADTFLCCNNVIPNVPSTTFRINRARDFNRFGTMEIDEVALYDRILSGAEIAAHFAALHPQVVKLGDMNCDGLVDGRDVDPFTLGVVNPAGYMAEYPDCTLLNGTFVSAATPHVADIPPFIDRVLNGPTTTFTQAVLADNPSLYYTLREGTGVATNLGSLGPGFNGAYFGNTSLVSSPAGDGATYFPGQGSFVYSLGNAPAAFMGNPTFTAEAVVLPTCAANGYSAMLGWGPGATGTEAFFGFPVNRTERVLAGFFNGGLLASNGSPHAQWLHVVWTRQGGGNASTGTTLYVNGQPVPLGPDPDLCCNSLVPNLGSSQFRVNETSFTGGQYFVGSIDEVALYDHILTPARVLSHYNTLAH